MQSISRLMCSSNTRLKVVGRSKIWGRPVEMSCSIIPGWYRGYLYVIIWVGQFSSLPPCSDGPCTLSWSLSRAFCFSLVNSKNAQCNRPASYFTWGIFQDTEEKKWGDFLKNLIILLLILKILILNFNWNKKRLRLILGAIKTKP